MSINSNNSFRPISPQAASSMDAVGAQKPDLKYSINALSKLLDAEGKTKLPQEIEQFLITHADIKNREIERDPHKERLLDLFDEFRKLVAISNQLEKRYPSGASEAGDLLYSLNYLLVLAAV